MMEIKKFRNKEELELSFFKEIDLPISRITEEDFKKVDNYFRNNLQYVEIVKIEDEMAIGWNQKFQENIILVQNSDLKVGEFILTDETIIIRTDAPEKWVDWLEYSSSERVYLSNFHTDFLTNKNVIDEIERQKLERVKEREEEEKNRLEEQNKEIETKSNESENYEKNGIFLSEDVKVFSDELSFNNDIKFKLKEPVNKLIDYNNICYINRNVNSYQMDDFLIEKGISYLKYEENKEIGNVEFSNDETKINGVKVSKNKVKFIINRIKTKDGITISPEKIKLLNSLTGMKVDLLELNEFRLDILDKNLNIPVNISLVDNNTFKVDLLGIERQLDWNNIKDIFFYSGGRSINKYWNLNMILKYIALIKMPKQELYDYLKKVCVLDGLDDK